MRSPFMLMLLPIAIAAAPTLAAAPPRFAARPGAFRPDLFFMGRTRGAGTVKVVTSSRPRLLAVRSVGRAAAGGELVLDQSIRVDGKPSTRTFRIRRAPDGAWVGTLSDAAGPVRATVAGPTMRLAYPMRRFGLRMNQTLTLQSGGRTLLNRATVTLLGIPVARIAETIEKLD